MPSDRMKKIEIVKYKPNWALLFEVEVKEIKAPFEHNCIEIAHIGLTSLPELRPKPIIDILFVVKDIQEVDKVTKTMKSLGYEAKGEYGIVPPATLLGITLLGHENQLVKIDATIKKN